MLRKKKTSIKKLIPKRKKYFKKHKMYQRLTVKTKTEKNFFDQSYGSFGGDLE